MGWLVVVSDDDKLSCRREHEIVTRMTKVDKSALSAIPIKVFTHRTSSAVVPSY